MWVAGQQQHIEQAEDGVAGELSFGLVSWICEIVAGMHGLPLSCPVSKGVR